MRAGGHIIDIVRPDPDIPDRPLLIEIQTRSFSNMKRKLHGLLAGGWRVQLVHPIALERWIVRIDGDGVIVSRRKSPRRGILADLFYELVYMPDIFAAAPGRITLDIRLTREDQILLDDGRGSWRRKGWSVADRRLLGIVEQVVFAAPGDFARFLPDTLPAAFTAADLSAHGATPLPLTYKLLYSLRAMGLVAEAGKRGRAKLYTRL